jgi:hypothetical protein
LFNNVFNLAISNGNFFIAFSVRVNFNHGLSSTLASVDFVSVVGTEDGVVIEVSVVVTEDVVVIEVSVVVIEDEVVVDVSDEEEL